MRNAIALLFSLVALVAVVCAYVLLPDVRSVERPASETAIWSTQEDALTTPSVAGGDMGRCDVRVQVPEIEHVVDAVWAPGSDVLAVTRIVTLPSARTPTGYWEEQNLTLVNVRTGGVRHLGHGKMPKWSGSGAYLSYWIDRGQLHIMLNGQIVARVDASQPDVAWVGDELFYFYGDEIRTWKAGRSWTVSRVSPSVAPSYPRDDAYFSADGTHFSITRNWADGVVEHFVGATATGHGMWLPDAGRSLVQWSPKGSDLLVRAPGWAALRRADGSAKALSLWELGGPVHGWTADGRPYFGHLSPTIPGGNEVDTFHVWGGGTVALPNLFGPRVFSTDGQFFAGVSRTGLYSTQLEVYRCGAQPDASATTRATALARSRVEGIEGDGRRFVRPVAGAITQFLQPGHTGIDVTAPLGALLFAPDDGYVSSVGFVPAGGYRVCTMHAGGLESCHYHTGLPLVAQGDAVVRGQAVALVGMSGTTTAPHTHWEAKQDGAIVDPLRR